MSQALLWIHGMLVRRQMDNKKIRVLVITLDSWNINNVTGSTMSSIFEGIEDFEIANIYLRNGIPNNRIVDNYFQITNTQIVRSIIKGGKAGKVIINKDINEENSNDINIKKKGITKFIYAHKWQVFYWVEELLWATQKWKSDSLKKFVSTFNPDVIFLPIFYNCYTNKVGLYIKKITNKPLISYISDDNYTLKQFNLSPLYWIDRFIKRPVIKKVIKESTKLYVISDVEKKDMDNIFHINSTILTKGDDFSLPYEGKKHLNVPYRLTFLGGLGNNRDKTLLEFANCINEFNILKEEIIFTLDIYSRTYKDDEYISRLNKMDGICFHGPIKSSLIDSVYQHSDILVHLEPKDLKNRLYYHHSFSTKIVDCMKAQRCILSFGGSTGTTEYLRNHDCAMVINNRKQLFSLLEQITYCPNLLNEYACKAYQDGKIYHSRFDIQNKLVKDFYKVCNNK